MVFISRQESFVCGHCGASVSPLPQGTCRNHCPLCLWSRHVDDEGPGDRESDCRGMMEPISLDQRSKKGFRILHRCEVCGKELWNRAAPDDASRALTKIIEQKK